MGPGRSFAAVTTFSELLDARSDGEDVRLHFGREVHGAFGGAFGGLLAAAAVHVARRVRPDATPAGLDCRFLRSLPAGDAVASAVALHQGRSLTVVRVDLHDETGRLATTATVSLAAAEALYPLDVGGLSVADPPRWRDWSLPPGVEAPIVGLLEAKLAGLADGAVAVQVTLPWDAGAETSAEAACVVADLSVGPPVGAASEDAWRPHPNPDVSLRFAPVAAVDGPLVGSGRLVRISGGLGVVGVDVYTGGVPFATGSATALVLAGR